MKLVHAIEGLSLLGWARLWMVHPDPDIVRVVRSVCAIRPEFAHCLGL